MNIIQQNTGWIEVICGSMYSGKTEELIKRLKRCQYANQKIQVFKPAIDDRYDATDIVSHSMLKFKAIAVKNCDDIKKQVLPETEVIAIDEVQFFDENILELVQELADSGKRVIVAGLDQDYLGKPFGPVPMLLAIAEYITKNLAICVKCGNPANRTQRLVHDDHKILVGADKIYEARCRNCHDKEI